MKKIVVFFTLFYLLILGVFPASTIYNFPLKQPVFLFFLVSVIAYFYINKAQIKVYACDIVHLLAVIFFIINVLIGAINDYDWRMVIAQIIPLLTTLLSVYIVVLLIRNKIIHHGLLADTIFCSYFLYGVIKLSLLVFLLIGVVKWADMLTFFKVTSYTPVGLEISGGFPRMNYVALDMAFLMCYFQWLFFYKKRNVFFMFFVHVVAFAVIFSAFSRYLFAMYFLFMSIYLYTRGLMSKIFALVMIFTIVVYNINYLGDVFSQRFIDQEQSDNYRLEMISELSSAADDFAIIGAGSGSHVDNYIRSIDAPYSYEVQPLAFLFQFGIWWVGYVFMFFLIYLFSIFEVNSSNHKRVCKHIQNYYAKEGLYSFSCLSILALATFTNQYIGSTSIIGLFVVWYISFYKINSSKNVFLKTPVHSL